MALQLNDEILKRIQAETPEKSEEALINEVIDEELAKDEPDFELIEALTASLLELQGSDGGEVNAPDEAGIIKAAQKKPVTTSRIILRALLVAAIILTTTFTANAAYRTATGTDIIGNLVSSVEQNKKEKKTDEPTTAAKAKSTKRKANSYSGKYKKKSAEKKNEETTSTTAETTTEEETSAYEPATDEDGIMIIEPLPDEEEAAESPAETETTESQTDPEE